MKDRSIELDNEQRTDWPPDRRNGLAELGALMFARDGGFDNMARPGGDFEKKVREIPVEAELALIELNNPGIPTTAEIRRPLEPH